MMTDVGSEADMSDGRTSPVEIARPARTLRVSYCNLGSRWHAVSPDVRRLDEHGATLDEVRQKTRARLRKWLAPEVHIKETVEEGGLSLSHATPSLIRVDTAGTPIFLIVTHYARTEATPRATVDVEVHRTRVGA